MNRLCRLVQLPVRQQCLLARTLSVLAVIRFGVWLFPFRDVLRILRKFQPAGSDWRAFESPSIDELVWAVKAVSRYIPNTTCLTQALSVQFLLARSGYPSQVQIGVAQGEERRFEAHAWVECRGAVVIGASGRYTTLLSLESGR
jgi:hypothetical protein